MSSDYLMIDVPVKCAFAKAKKGQTYGKHTVTLVFDENGALKHVSSECERIHGAHAIDALGTQNTCMEAVKTTLDLAQGKTVPFDGAKDTFESMLFDAWVKLDRHVQQLQSRREVHKRLPRVPDRKLHVFRRVLLHTGMGHLFRLERDTYHGNITLRTLMKSGDRLVAMYNAKPDTWTPVSYEPKTRYKGMHTISFRDGRKTHAYCAFCGEYYERMARHVRSEQHAQSVQKWIARATKLVTMRGVRAMNKNGFTPFVPKAERQCKNNHWKEVNQVLDGKTWPEVINEEAIQRAPSPEILHLWDMGMRGLAVEQYCQSYARVSKHTARKLLELLPPTFGESQ